MSQKTLLDRYREQHRAIKFINPYQFLGWVGALGILFALAMSAFVSWHNSVVGQVQPQHLVLRIAVGWAAFLPIIIFMYFKFLRPAIQKAEQERAEKQLSDGQHKAK